MNKEYSSIEKLIEDKFPSMISHQKSEEKVNVQEYIDKVSYQFSQEIEKIIKS